MQIRLRRRIAQGLAMFAASILVLVGLSTSAAQAESGIEIDDAVQVDGVLAEEPNMAYVHWRNPSWSYNGGVGDIRSYGENIVVLDFKADGWGTRGQLQVLKWDSNGSRYAQNHGGVCFDDTNRQNAPLGKTVCDRNVGEGKYFRIHVWASNSGTYRWHAYSPWIKA